MTTPARVALGKAAAEMVKPGQKVGLGTGRTAAEFIKALAARKLEGLICTATSEASAELARSLGLRVVSPDEIGSLDIDIDGADEIHGPTKAVIKGGGGALLREHLVARLAKEVLIIADSYKIVDDLGKFPLPVEIVKFACMSTTAQVKALGFGKPVLRRDKSSGEPYLTDEGHYILDLEGAHGKLGPDYAKTVAQLVALPGVVDVGLWPSVATQVLLVDGDGKTKLLES